MTKYNEIALIGEVVSNQRKKLTTQILKQVMHQLLYNYTLKEIKVEQYIYNDKSTPFVCFKIKLTQLTLVLILKLNIVLTRV
jgi:hypothetical protein